MAHRDDALRASVVSVGTASFPDRSHAPELSFDPRALPDDVTLAPLYEPVPRSSSSSGAWLAPLAAVLLVAALFAYTYVSAPVVPVWDGWTWIDQAKAFHEGGFAAYWATHPLYHAQHLYALPSAVVLATGPFFDYSLRPYAFLSLTLLVALALLAHRCARRHGLGRYEALLVFASIASFRQYENLVFGFQFGLVACVLLGSAAVVVAATRRDRAGLLLALLLALGSLLSSSAGLMAVVCVPIARRFDRSRPRTWIELVLGAGLSLAALQGLILATAPESFVTDAASRIEIARLPTLFLDGAKLIGGGFASGTASTSIGILVLAATGTRIAVQTWSARRPDALSSLALFGLLTSLTVDVARSPFEHPESRHAIFAAPMIAVFVIDVLRFLRTTRAPQPLLAVLVALGCTWQQADAARDALDYRRTIADWECETRIFVATTATHGELGRTEIGRVNPGPPKHIRGLMEFLRDRRWSIFAPSDAGLVLHDALPSRAANGARTERDGDLLRVHGPGHVFEPLRCPFASGGSARLSVDAALDGRAAFGFVVRDAQGNERSNVSQPLRGDGGFAMQSMRVDVGPGETLEPYVYVPDAESTVRVRTFTTVLVRRSAAP